MIISHGILIKMRNDSDFYVEKIKIHIMFDNIFPKIMSFMRYVERCDGAVQAASGNMIGCMCFACWITETTNTYSECHTDCFIHSNSGYINSPHYYVKFSLSC
jgi:hypothetical protein